MSVTQALKAVRSGNCDLINRMAENGAFDNITAEDKSLLVKTAAEAGQSAMLRFLFESHHLYSADSDLQGRNLLHAAASSGDTDTVLFAMDVLGLDPLGGDLQGVTPLDLAQQARNQGAFRLLSSRLGFTPDRGYRNPVLRGCHPDPSMLRIGEDYYLIRSEEHLLRRVMRSRCRLMSMSNPQGASPTAWQRRRKTPSSIQPAETSAGTSGRPGQEISSVFPRA